MPGKFGLPAATAFVTGAVAVLVFHQPALALLHAAGLTPFPAYPTRPTSPLGSPARRFRVAVRSEHATLRPCRCRIATPAE